MLKTKVYAEYEVVEGSLKDFIKKAIIPALMLLGPVACGTQHDDKGGGGPSTQPQPQKAEQTMDKALSAKNVKCKIKVVDDGSIWTFTDSKKDVVELKLPEGDKLDRNTIEVVKEPKTDAMDRLKEALLDSFAFGWEHMEKKYDCEMEPRTLSPTQPNL